MSAIHQTKRVHGASNQIKLVSPVTGSVTLIDKPSDWTDIQPEGVSFNVGDTVKFTNDYGASFELNVWGFGNPEKHPYGRCVYIFTDCYWFPAKPSQCEKVSA